MLAVSGLYVEIESYADTFDSPKSSLKFVALKPVKVLDPSILFVVDDSTSLVFLVFKSPGRVTVARFGAVEVL